MRPEFLKGYLVGGGAMRDAAGWVRVDAQQVW